MFKVNNKNTRSAKLASLLFLFCLLVKYFSFRSLVFRFWTEQLNIYEITLEMCLPTEGKQLFCADYFTKLSTVGVAFNRSINAQD